MSVMIYIYGMCSILGHVYKSKRSYDVFCMYVCSYCKVHLIHGLIPNGLHKIIKQCACVHVSFENINIDAPT